MNKRHQAQPTGANQHSNASARRWRQLFITTVLALCALLGGTAEARAQSAIDGFDPGANGSVKTIAVQPDGKILIGGGFSMLGGQPRVNIGRLNPDGTIDTGFNPGADFVPGGSGEVNTLAVQGDGKILVGGFFDTVGGQPRPFIARLNSDGTVDLTFNPGANNTIHTIVVQADGRILVGGEFTMLGGQPRSFIGRLNPDGSLDTTFNPGAGSVVFAFLRQADGKIVVGGFFNTLAGQPRSRIGRLNPDGSLDASFNPGADATVFTLALQADGKIVVGGDFNSLGGQPRNKIGRLNSNGTLDAAFNPGAGSTVRTIVVQSDGKILVGGNFPTLGGGATTARNNIGRLNPDGMIDATFNPGAGNTINTVALQADGKILVGGLFNTLGGGGTGTTLRNRIGRLYADGSLDNTLDPGANGDVYALAVQADGKILVGGDFTMLGGGGSGTTARSRIGRLNPDGSLDTTFNPGANDIVRALAVQADGKILVGGQFTTLGGGGTGTTTRNRIGRLNPDGSVDTTFNPGANNFVAALAVQPDGKIIVGGQFTTLGGGGTGTTTRNRIGRLNPDGSLDASFDPGANSTVWTLALQADGKILVGGFFTGMGGGTGTTPRNFIGRLNPDGTLDATFNPGANSDVFALALQADGKIVVGGFFTGMGGGTGTTPRSRIARLNPDGSLDTSFNPGANNAVYASAIQADGKILVVGDFTTLGGGGTGTAARNHIGRLNSDGSLDTTFDPGASGQAIALALQADGKILVGGAFSMLGGGGTGTATRNRIGRLTNNIAAQQTLSVSFRGTSINWQRSGSSPELERVTFELSFDGVNFTPIGNATRAGNSSNWLMTSLNLPTQQNLYVRARGFYRTGYLTGSYSVVESVRNAYISVTSTSTLFDFDGDKKADVSVWNPNNHNWHIIDSMTGNARTQLDWGNGSLGDIAVPADYDGDGRTDIAVWRPSEGNFYVVNSGTNAPSVRNWGGSGDIPVPADYDGDAKADYAVWREAEGNWYIINSQTNTVTVRGWGAVGDKPMPRDYDADGKADICVFRPSEGTWYVINSATNTVTVQGWGSSTDKLVAADYDGDGRADIAVFRESEGNWYILRSTGGVTLRNWGGTGDMAVPADYDGDGLTDIAVFRPTEGTWYIIQSASNSVRTAFLGGSGDVPAPSTVVR